MSDDSQVAAELYGLWTAGKISMPQVAAVYAQASRDLHNTSWREAEAFERSAVTVERGGFLPEFTAVRHLGPVYPHWAALRDLLQEIMVKTTGNLLDASDALCMIASGYAEDDAQVAAELRSLIDDRLGDPGLDHPPTSIPVVKRPGDPHDTRSTEVTIDVPLLPDIEIEIEVPTR